MSAYFIMRSLEAEKKPCDLNKTIRMSLGHQPNIRWKCCCITEVPQNVLFEVFLHPVCCLVSLHAKKFVLFRPRECYDYKGEAGEGVE